MIIKLDLSCKNESVTPPKISLSGLTLAVGGTVIDLSQIPEGGANEWDGPSVVKGIVTRDYIEIVYPYSTDNYEPMQSTNPADFEIELLDGQTLKCPLIKRPMRVVEEEPTGEQP